MDVLANNPVYVFADFRLDPTRRLLQRNAQTIALHPKAFDLLLALVENRDSVLSKVELLDTVWNGRFVEENNLAVQISTLRKIFGEKKDEHRFIVTVPGKGYRFVADVREAVGETEEFVLESETVSRFILEDEEPINENIAALPKPSKKFRWTIALPLVLLAMLGIGGYAWRLSQQAKISPAALPFQAASIKRLTSKGNVQLAALSPDGKLFAFTTADFQQQSLWLGYVEGGDYIQLRPSSEVLYHWLAFAPDGSSLFYTMSDAATPTTLYKSPVFGGVPQRIEGLPEEKIYRFAWSRDGKQFAFVRGTEIRDVILIHNSK